MSLLIYICDRFLLLWYKENEMVIIEKCLLLISFFLLQIIICGIVILNKLLMNRSILLSNRFLFAAVILGASTIVYTALKKLYGKNYHGIISSYSKSIDLSNFTIIVCFVMIWILSFSIPWGGLYFITKGMN